MWKLLKSEFQYNKAAVSMTYAIAVIYLFADFIWRLGGIYVMFGNTAPVIFIAIAVILSKYSKEKRLRFHLCLPMALKQVSAARFLFILLFQTGLFLLWFTDFLFRYAGLDNEAHWSLFAMHAYVLILVGFFVIHHDSGHFRTGKPRIIYLSLAILFLAWIAWLLMKGHIEIRHFVFGSTFKKNFLDVFFYYLACTSLVYVSHAVFMRRISYKD
ncbi:MAG: hypothetical protein ACE5I1_09040 [bacterium]